MLPQRSFFFFFLTTLFSATVLAQTTAPALKAPLSLITDPSWDVSGSQDRFGEYPLPGERIATATSALAGGTRKAVAADYNDRSKIIPGAVPIWGKRQDSGEGEAYQFRKNIALGAEPIRKATLEINCDDVARVYINKRLVSVDKRDGKLKDGYDVWFLFRSVTGFMFNRIYTYDVTDYFFTQVTNTILIEAVSLAFDGSHANVSAKIVLEFGPLPEPKRPVAAAKSKPAAQTQAPAKPVAPAPAPADVPEKTVFRAGQDPALEQLHVGSVLELGNVYFKADDHRIDPASYPTLAALASFMKRHPGLKIEVGGHTNLRPNESFAAGLSANRARAVMQYLTDNGVAPRRITYKGYGKSQPRINAISKEADAANQRVEVKVLEK